MFARTEFHFFYYYFHGHLCVKEFEGGFVRLMRQFMEIALEKSYRHTNLLNPSIFQ